MARHSATQPATAPDQLVTAAISIVLVIHIFCVLVALSGNVLRSALQDQLLRGFFRPYLEAVNLDPDATPYHFARASVDDVDHRWEVLPAGRSAASESDWVTLPPQGIRWSESVKRWQRSAKLVAMQAGLENEEAAAEMARGVARYAFHQLQIRPAQIRCRRIHDIETFVTSGQDGPLEFPYVANVVIDSTGRVSISSSSARRETALPETSSETPAP